MRDPSKMVTLRSQKVLNLAYEEAIRLNSDSVGPEHLLLGLISEEEGVAGRVLAGMGVTLPEARKIVESHSRRMSTREVQLSSLSKQVLENAAIEAKKLHHHYIGTEHLLLGLIAKPEGAGVQVLEQLNVDLVQLKDQVALILIGPSTPELTSMAPFRHLAAFSAGSLDELIHQLGDWENEHPNVKVASLTLRVYYLPSDQ